MSVAGWKNGPDGKPNGSRPRRQRNYYALMVTVAIMGDELCIYCERPLGPGNSDVDRVDPQLGYAPFNIAMLCRKCNKERGELQGAGNDWCNVDQYANDVFEASKGVGIPTEPEANEWWQGWRDPPQRCSGRYC